MAGNSFGELFRVTAFGESHGPALGCVIDGCPAGLEVSTADIERELQRRRPAQGGASSARDEKDVPEILSGVFEGKTLGSPIAIIVRNTDHNPAEYDKLKELYRPGHADWTWEAKYGLRDHRGGGRSSGRETLCRVAAGAVAKAFLAQTGIAIKAWVSSIGGINMPAPNEPDFNIEEIERNPLRLPCALRVKQALSMIETLRAEGDSCGGEVNCLVTGLKPGLGEPVFDKLDSRLANAILSIGGCKGVEFGAGFTAARMRGSENNDGPIPGREPPALGVPAMDFKTNNSGGILGGISSGQELLFRAAFKPPASIGKAQKTLDRAGAEQELIIEGRHDICIAPRAAPVVEAMTAIVIADFILIQRAARL